MDDLDHRNLGVKLNLWHLQEDAPGMVFWHPRGYAVYRVLEDYVRRKMRRAGYAEVRTPQLLPQELWGRSGHWDKFGEHMFRVEEGEQAMALKPMSCPCHVQIFNKGLRRGGSFRSAMPSSAPATAMSLPVRSTASCGRAPSSKTTPTCSAASRTWRPKSHASSPAGRGLPRPRLSQLRSGAGHAARGARRRRRDLGLVRGEARRCRAAVRPCTSNQSRRRCVLRPKLEFALRDRLGRSWQCGTVQLDGVLPQRLEASYVAPDGSRATPFMIHHAVFGSLGRMIAILLERLWRRASVLAVAGPGRGCADLERPGRIRRGCVGGVRGCRDPGRCL